MKKKKVSEQIGQGFAYLQDAIDRMVTFGCKKMKSFGEKKEEAKEIHPVKKGAKSVAKFVGEIGTSFYDKYLQIKKSREKEENKK